MLVPKEDGALRLYVDYRCLNKVTIKEIYFISRMDERTDFLKNATVVSVLNADSGYWQLKLNERNRYKSVFVAHHGLY